MKALILLIGIAAFSSASAQQKNVYNLQDYQNSKTITLKDSLDKIFNQQQLFFIPDRIKASDKLPLTYLTANGETVIYGAGSMPYIKPDMNFHKTMPNLNYKDFIQQIQDSKDAGQIPNGANLNQDNIISKKK